jgi:hypothetical protein
MNKKLMVLSEDEREGHHFGIIYVYDIESDVDRGITDPTPLTKFDINTLDPHRNLELFFTSFEAFRTHDPNVMKIFVANITKTVYAIEVRVSDFSVISISDMDIEELVLERDAYITETTSFWAVKVVNYTEVTI